MADILLVYDNGNCYIFKQRLFKLNVRQFIYFNKAYRNIINIDFSSKRIINIKQSTYWHTHDALLFHIYLHKHITFKFACFKKIKLTQ